MPQNLGERNGHSVGSELQKANALGLENYVNDAVSPPNGCHEICPNTSALCEEKLKKGKVCESELISHYINFPTESSSSCAKGVRQALNVLFGKNEKYGETEPATHALSYNENVLAKWQTPNQRFKKISDPGNKYKNFDVRVLQPSPGCKYADVAKYGHIEFYFNGSWYSDNKQQGSAWDGNKSSKCYKSMSIYRLSNK
jgi:hypothetical protein